MMAIHFFLRRGTTDLWNDKIDIYHILQCGQKLPYHHDSTTARLLRKIISVGLSYNKGGVPHWNTECNYFVAKNVNGHGYTMEHYCTA